MRVLLLPLQLTVLTTKTEDSSNYAAVLFLGYAVIVISQGSSKLGENLPRTNL